MERKRKKELRELNLKAWDGERDLFKVNTSLDSSLKKNTAFIKRLRTAISTPGLNTFLQDIRSLSLHKYLSEIITACFEGLCKVKTPGEISAAVEIVSALHCRFGQEEFTGQLGWLMGRALSTPEKPHLKNLSPEAKEKEEKERLARQRILLRVATELWLVGVLRSLEDVVRPDDAGKGKENLPSTTTKLSEGGARAKNSVNGARPNNHNDAEPFPLEVLKDLLGHDREHANLPLVVIFVKSFGWEILGARAESGEGRKAVAADGTVAVTSEGEDSSAAEDASPAEPTYNDAPIVSEELQSRFRNVLGRYFEDVKVHLIRNQKALATQARRNAEAYVKSGEVFEDRQGNHEKAVKSQEKLIANAQVLSEVLGSEMPDLKESDEDAAGGDGEIGLVKTGEYLRGQAEGAGIWEDEEERRFYENLVDLKDRVPAILLEDAKKKKPEGDEQVGKQAEETKEDSEMVSASATEETKQTDGDDQSTAIANKTVGAQVDGLLKRLKDVTSKEMVDEIAIDFCFLNSKASRNRMLKAISTIPKGRTDLLPLWSRLAATLGKYMADVPQGLITHLDAEFRSLQRRKEKGFLDQVRTSNIRYLAELTKFGVVPEHVIFHCLRVSLDEFSRMNIEIICHLLENCGRYLLRNPVTSPRMTSFLDTLQRKKGAQHLGQQERMLIENAMYYVNPPQRAAIQQKERSPISQFIRKLIYLDMNKRNTLKIIKQIRKLHWEDQEVFDVLERVFSKPGKVKYSNIHILAIIAAALYRYHQEWVITVIDDLLENITVGLEHNDFKANQRRIAEVKYLGELYTYRMVDSPVIFDTLYRLVTFGHDGGIPKVDKFCPLDMPDDFFRMRLVCTLLDTCGQFFRKGAAEKKLDFFIVFFQYYMFTKDPVPMDVEFMIQETISSLRPEVKLAVDLNEASQQFAAAVSQNYQAPEEEKPVDIDSGDELSSEDDDDEDAHGQRRDAGQSSSEEAEAELSGDDNESDADSEEESIVVTRQQEERDPEIEAEFDREFAKMMAESLDSRKFERKPLFDVPLPMKKNAREMATTEEGQPDSDIAPPNTMAFSLLTKRGNRQQTRTVELPSDSHFAVAMKTQQEAERAEQQRIKNLVLNYDLRDEDLDGEDDFLFPLEPNLNTKSLEGSEKANASAPRTDRAVSNRAGQRARKLQLSDVDWYGPKETPSPNLAPKSSSSSTTTSRPSGFRYRGQGRGSSLGRGPVRGRGLLSG